MNTLTSLLHRLRDHRGVPSPDDESGNSLIEYALLLALIVIVCLVAVQMIGDQTTSSLSSAASSL